jgi:glucoamylase
VKLLVSAADGKPRDLVESVYDRYVTNRRERQPIEVWKLNRQVDAVSMRALLRIQASLPFLLHWTIDDWVHSTDIRSTMTRIGIEFVDLPLPQQETTIRFTFLWTEKNRWEGKDYTVEVR